jgi:hypothetical protein
VTYNEAELERLEVEAVNACTDYLKAVYGTKEDDVAREAMRIARENLAAHKEGREPAMQFVDEKIEPTFTFDDDFGDAEALSAMYTQVGGDHYSKRAIQPIEFIAANDLNFMEGSIVKYIVRWRDKGGFQDLEKIKQYVDLLIEMENKYVKPT